MSDGEWHTVLAKFNPTYMEITVDGATETLRPSSAAGGEGPYSYDVRKIKGFTAPPYTLLDLVCTGQVGSWLG